MIRRLNLIWRALLRLREAEGGGLGEQAAAALTASHAHTRTRTARRQNGVIPGELAWAVGVAARLLRPHPTCLRRALVLTSLLRDSGIPAQVCLGARVSGECQLEAHAWVEVEGDPVAEAADIEAHFPRLHGGRTAAPDRAMHPSGDGELHGRAPGRVGITGSTGARGAPRGY
jgi:hypothetical protein